MSNSPSTQEYTPAEAHSPQLASVLQLLNATPADVAANRAGQLSAQQAARLGRTLRNNWFLFVLAAVLFVTVAGAAWLADIPIAALIFGGLGLLLLAVFYWSLRTRMEARRVGAVKALSGPWTLTRSRRRRAGGQANTSHSLTIDGVRLRISPELFVALEQLTATRGGDSNRHGDEEYTVYYLAGERAILSIANGVDALSPIVRDRGVRANPVAGGPGDGVHTQIRQAIAVLEGWRTGGEQVPSGQQAHAAALADLAAGGPAAIPHLAPLLHKRRYQELVAQMGTVAVTPLMRELAREGDLVESPLLTATVHTLTAIPLDDLEKSLAFYLERRHPPAVRMAAVRALGHRRNPQRTRVLREAAQDPEPAIAMHAQHALARIDYRNGRF